MHTKSLAVLKRQQMRKKMVQKAKECMKAKASKSEIYGKMQDVFIEMETSPKVYKTYPSHYLISYSFAVKNLMSHL